MRILICDDERCYSEALKACIQSWGDDRDFSNYALDIFDSSEEMLDKIGNKASYDIAFLDIQFPRELDGLSVAKILRRQNEQMIIVFVSNYDKYAVEGYKVDAYRFLTKPITKLQVFECLDMAYHRWNATKDDPFLIVENNTHIHRLLYRNICYVESIGHYLYFHTAKSGDEPVRKRGKLSELTDLLADDMFIQCHQSFILNLTYIQTITRSKVILANGFEIPISTKYRVNLIAKFREYYQGG